MFAFDKKAGVPCPNLDGCDRCRVHDRLEAEGFGGCRAYDCLGAGQRVTAMFAGRSWRDDPRVRRLMIEAFAEMREVCELLVMIEAALRLGLPAASEAECRELLRAIDPPQGWTLGALEDYRRRCERVFATLRKECA
ncbi:MAG: hypothetical protein QM723_38800 [Myxococcaceae bacterium]